MYDAYAGERLVRHGLRRDYAAVPSDPTAFTRGDLIMEIAKGRVALITGAGGAISESIAQALASGGAKVTVTGTDAKSVGPLGSKINELLSRHGRVDILVNACSQANGKGIADVTDEDWESVIRANLSSTFFFCREAIRHMRENKYGRIINLTSFYYLGWPGMANYSAATSGAFGLTRSLALELAKDDITVNCVVQGEILTADSSLSVEEVAKLADSHPVKRLGKPEDVARAVAFFASDASRYVTGQTLFVCGGRSLYSSMSA